MTGSMHILMTVNAAWNIWNFRRPLVEALQADGHRVTVLAPPDDAVQDLERLGCRVRPLEMSVKGLNPLEDMRLQRRFARIFRETRPDAVLSYAVDASAADAIGVVVARGPAIVSKAALVFDATVDDAPKTATKHGQLAALGIVPRDTA